MTASVLDLEAYRRIREREQVRQVKLALLDDELSMELAVVLGDATLCQACARLCMGLVWRMTLVPEGACWMCDHCGAEFEGGCNG